MARNLIVTALVAAIIGGLAVAYTVLKQPEVPPVKAFARGQEVRFIHTEASDPQVAEMLTKMMASPVLVVPSLAQVPEGVLATVYVFRNGVKGEGPFGFQPDVFDRPPREPGYSPLRAVHLVT